MTAGQRRKARAPRHSLRMIVLPVIAVGFAGAAHLLSEDLVARSLREDAATTAQAWQGYFSGGFNGLEQVLQSGQLNAQQRDFIVASARVGRVFRFKLFDARGRLVLASDKAGAPPVSIPLRDHDGGAVRAIEFQRTVVDVFQRMKVPGLPASYAEAHVPLLAQDGEVLGLVEINIDQSRSATLFRQAFQGYSLSLAALTATALLGLSLLSSIRRKVTVHGDTSSLPERSAEIAAVSEEPFVIVPMSPVDMVEENFDDWLARVAEDAAQNIPERVGFECHLGLGAAALPSDAGRMAQCVSGLVAEASAALSFGSDTAGNAIVLMPRIVVSTKLTQRGIEVSISDNRLKPADHESASLTGFRQSALARGGGLDVNDTAGTGMTITAWWPDPFQQAKAA